MTLNLDLTFIYFESYGRSFQICKENDNEINHKTKNIETVEIVVNKQKIKITTMLNWAAMFLPSLHCLYMFYISSLLK